jgi:hypothetical protein
MNWRVRMIRLPENNSITRNGNITTLVTDDSFIFDKYRVAGQSVESIDGLGFIISYSESVNIGNYDLPPCYMVLTVVFKMTGEF